MKRLWFLAMYPWLIATSVHAQGPDDGIAGLCVLDLLVGSQVSRPYCPTDNPEFEVAVDAVVPLLETRLLAENEATAEDIASSRLSSEAFFQDNSGDPAMLEKMCQNASMISAIFSAEYLSKIAEQLKSNAQLRFTKGCL